MFKVHGTFQVRVDDEERIIAFTFTMRAGSEAEARTNSRYILTGHRKVAILDVEEV